MPQHAMQPFTHSGRSDTIASFFITEAFPQSWCPDIFQKSAALNIRSAVTSRNMPSLIAKIWFFSQCSALTGIKITF